MNKIGTTLLLPLFWLLCSLSAPALGQGLAQDTYFEEVPQYYSPTNYLYSSDTQFPLLKSQIKRGNSSITPGFYGFFDHVYDLKFAVFRLAAASPLEAGMVVSNNVTLSSALIKSSVKSFSELEAGGGWLDAGFVNAVSLTPAATEEPPSLLYKALRFLLIWTIVSMLVTPVFLRLKIH